MQLLAILFWLALAFFVVAAIGHGVWMLAAAVIRALFGGGHSYQSVWQVQVDARELDAVCRHLHRLLLRRAIDAAEYARLRDNIDPEYEHLGLQPPPRGEAPIRSIADAVPAQPAAVAPQQSVADLEVLSPDAVPAAIAASATDVELVVSVEPALPASAAPVSTAASPFDFPEQPARPSRRPWTSVLQSFLEEKNIRWGELASGLLIVGSAIGLIVSLRYELERRIPYFPALLFMLVTGAIHAAGAYSLKKWKLKTTSRGVLTIGLLLVPLNLLAACLMSGQQGAALIPVTHPMFLLAVAIAIAAYGTMTVASCRLLFGSQGWYPAVAILSCALWQIVVHRVSGATAGPWHATAILAVPVVCFLVSMLLYLQRAAPWQRSEDVEQRLLISGISLFALLTLLALFISQVGLRLGMIGLAAFWLPLLCVPLVLLGHRLGWSDRRRQELKLPAESEGSSVEDSSPESETVGDWFLLTAGTLVMLGTMLPLASLFFVWPSASRVLVSGVAGCVAFAAIAALGNMPAFSAAATALLSLVVVVGLQTLLTTTGLQDFAVQQLGGATFLTATSCFGLVLATVLAVGGGLLARHFSRGSATLARHGTAIAAAGGLSGMLSFVLVFLISAMQPAGVSLSSLSLILLLHTATALTAGAVVRRADVRRAGLILLLITLLHAFGASDAWRQWIPEWAGGTSILLPALLLHAISCSLGAVLCGMMTRQRAFIGEQSLWQAMKAELLLASAITATASMCVTFPAHGGTPQWIACDLLIASTCVLHAALRLWSPLWFAAFQIGLTAAGIYVVSAVAFHFGWTSGWWQPRQLQLMLTTAAVAALVWCALRRFVPKLPDHAWAVQRMSVDAALLGSLFIIVPIIGAFGCVVGINRELRLFDVASGLHQWLATADIPLRLLPMLAVLSVATSLAWRGPLRPLARPGFVLLQLAALFVAAGACAPWAATSSAMRWLIAAWTVVVGVVCLLLRRVSPSTTDDVERPHLLLTAVHVLAAAVVTTLLVLPFARSLWGGPIAGVDPAWPLAALSWQADYGFPLLIQLAALMMATIAARSDRLYRGGALLVGGLTIVLSLLVVFARVDHAAWFAIVLPLSGLVVAVYVLSWRGTGWWHPVDKESADVRTTLSGLGLAFTIAIPLIALWNVLATDGTILPEVWARWSSAWNWIALVATVAALGFAALDKHPIVMPLFAVLGLAAVGLSAATAAAHHELAIIAARRVVAGGLVVGAAALLLSSAAAQWRAVRRSHWDAWMAGTIAGWHLIAWIVLLTVRDAGLDRTWFAAANALLSASSAIAALQFGPAFAYLGAAHILAIFGERLLSPPGGPFPATANWCMSALAVYGMLMLAVDIWRQRTARPPRWHDRMIRMPTMAAGSMTALTVFAVGIEVVNQRLEANGFLLQFGSGIWLNHFSGWIAVATLGVLCVLLLWDRAGRRQIPRLYLWTIGVSGLVCASVSTGETLHVLLGLVIALVATLWAMIYRMQPMVTRIAELCRISHAETMMGAMQRWIVPTHLLLVLLCVVWQFFIVFVSDVRVLRMGAAFTPLILGMGTMAVAAVIRRRWLMTLSFALLAMFALSASWSDLSPTLEYLALRRWARAVLGLAVASVVLGAVAPRLWRIEGEWARSLQQTALGTAIATVVALSGLLINEVLEFVPNRGTPLPVAEAATVGVVLIATIVGLVIAALTPAIGDVAMSPARRKACVYLAEVVGACLAVHVSLAMPFLLRPEWRGFWPYLVMGLAFAAAAGGHLAQRQGLSPLAEPLLRTGVLLPLAPFVLMWFIPAASDYALVLFLGGLFYMAHAVVYRQARYALAAIVSGNLALWSLLQRYDALQFLMHPQLWLIPPALCVLIIVQWFREKLSVEQVSTVRYGALAVIYISSTSEIFLAGVGQQLWPPMVLVGLSVLGMMLGMALKIRAFLLVGCCFLFVSLVTMVMHAHRAIGHIWPWWVFGIGLGVAILTLFGLFEKKRTEMTAWLQRLRQWDV